MKILIAGGTGLIGQLLCQHWSDKHQITLLSHKPLSFQRKKRHSLNLSQVNFIDWSVMQRQEFDVVINLAGAPIANKTWTASRKKFLWDSRVLYTQKLVSVIQNWPKKPRIFLSGSAIGIYPNSRLDLDESTVIQSKNFSQSMCLAWEEEANALQSADTRVCLLRTGLVCTTQGGYLQQLLQMQMLHVIPQFGDGNNHIPWIHHQDYLQAIDWLMLNDQASGPYNLVAPEKIVQKAFLKVLRDELKNQYSPVVPNAMVKFLMGERVALFLDDLPVRPKKLLDQGFDFDIPNWKMAVKTLVK